MNSIGDKCQVGTLYSSNFPAVTTTTYGSFASPSSSGTFASVPGCNRYIIYASFVGTVGSPITTQSIGLTMPYINPFSVLSARSYVMLDNPAITSGITVQAAAENNGVSTSNIDITMTFSPALTTTETLKIVIELIPDNQ